MKNSYALILAVCASVLSASAAEVGPVIEVAPQAKDARNQTWASVAWCEGARCWLVVWREGYLNERRGDIWCARVSADGKPLDPAGVKLTPNEGFRDRPRVACDGKKFLVVWEGRPAGEGSSDEACFAASAAPSVRKRSWDV